MVKSFKYIFIYTFYSVFIFLFVVSCNSKKDNKSTLTEGEVVVAVDDAYFPILNQEKEAFENHYPNAIVTLKSIKEGASILALLQDSVRLAVSSRGITEEERLVFASKKINVRKYLLAYDAVTLVVGKNVTDTIFTLSQIKDILNGINTTKVVFEEGNNANLIFLKNKLGIKNFGKNVFALASANEIIEYVSSNPDAIGIVGAALMNDYDVAETKSNLNKIQVLGLNVDNHVYYPFQEDLYDSKYPLTREVYLLCSESGNYTGTGFVSFMLSEIGQRIVLKAGLLPAKTPSREIVIIKNKTK